MIRKWEVRIRFYCEVFHSETNNSFALVNYQDIYLHVFAKTVEGAEGAAINTLMVNGIVNMNEITESDYWITVCPALE